MSYQSYEYGEQLNDICVGDAGQSPKNGVKNCNATTQYHTSSLVQFDDHTQRSPCKLYNLLYTFMKPY